MPEMPKAAPLPERPPLHIDAGSLVIASPAEVSEASFSIPAVRALRAAKPQGTLLILANQDSAPMWRKLVEAGEVDQVIEHDSADSARKITRLLKDAEISIGASIAWEDSPAAQAFAKYGIPQRFGYPSEKLAKQLTDPIEVERKIGPIEHQVNHYLLFVEKLGADPFQASNFTSPARPAAAEVLQIAIAPGSDFGPAAEWPLERFTELAENISKHASLVILASPGRPGPARALAKALGQSVTALEGDDLLQLLATCHGLIANDGSIPHYASFVGTPSIILFGPNEPEWKRPLGRIHRVIRRHVPCSGCLLNKCPLDHRCMSEITLPEVLEELRSLFAS